MRHWKLKLVDQKDDDHGDVVVVADGEIIGTWELVHGVFYAFTPNGAESYLFFEPFAGMMCRKISAWHEYKVPQYWEAVPGHTEPMPGDGTHP